MNSRDISLLTHDVATLRIVKEFGPVSMAVLRNAETRPPAEPLSERVADLVSMGLVAKRRKNHGGAFYFEITEAGELALQANGGAGAAAAAPAPAPIVAAPRYMPPAGSYNGAELRPYTGRGVEALRAFTLPSLVNGERVERTRAPIILSTTTKVEALRAGARGRS